MTKRLQVLLVETELRDIQRLARSRHMTTAEWVRQALRGALEAQGASSVTDKLAAVRRACEHAYPTADIDELLAQVERGYTGPEA
jgi:hypothetical protein